MMGLEHTLNHDWGEWMSGHPEAHNEWFGEIEREFKSKFPKPGIEHHAEWFKKFKDHILENFGQNLERIGQFGVWAKEAGITDMSLLKAVAKEFLED